MKTTLLLFPSLLLMVVACAPPETMVEKSSDQLSLEGTWRLVKTIDIGHEDISDRMDSDHKMYMKHINKTHWTWAEYDYQQHKLLGAGGGTYTLKDNVYTENVQFYFPAGSNELGQAIPFTVEFVDSLWRHTGYVKIMEFDPETGESNAVDSAIIDEYWQRVDTSPISDNNLTLYSTWNLLSYKNPADSIWSEYPEFVGYTKILTPTHWVYAKYNKSADELMGMAGGTYTIEGDQYLEKINFLFPENINIVGTTSTFSWEFPADHQWHIWGTVNGRDDNVIAIDEIWQRYGSENIAMAQ